MKKMFNFKQSPEMTVAQVKQMSDVIDSMTALNEDQKQLLLYTGVWTHNAVLPAKVLERTTMNALESKALFFYHNELAEKYPFAIGLAHSNLGKQFSKNPVQIKKFYNLFAGYVSPQVDILPSDIKGHHSRYVSRRLARAVMEFGKSTLRKDLEKTLVQKELIVKIPADSSYDAVTVRLDYMCTKTIEAGIVPPDLSIIVSPVTKEDGMSPFNVRLSDDNLMGRIGEIQINLPFNYGIRGGERHLDRLSPYSKKDLSILNQSIKLGVLTFLEKQYGRELRKVKQ